MSKQQNRSKTRIISRFFIKNSLVSKYIDIRDDLVGMYLYRLFNKRPNFSLNYDAEKGGADFVVGVSNERIVVEVGINKVKYNQVIQTAKKVSAKYGIIISEKISELEYNEEANAVKIPLKYFLLT